MSIRKILIFLLCVAAVAVISSYITNRVMRSSSCSEAEALPSYEVLNSRLGLTDAQKAAVRKIEEDFALREAPLREAFYHANSALAKLIATENAYTPQVAAAVEHVHMCMGELQKASISHLFELSGQLDEHQRQILMQDVALALGECSGK